MRRHLAHDQEAGGRDFPAQPRKGAQQHLGTLRGGEEAEGGNNQSPGSIPRSGAGLRRRGRRQGVQAQVMRHGRDARQRTAGQHPVAGESIVDDEAQTGVHHPLE